MKAIIIIGLLVMFLVIVQFASGKTVDEVIDKFMDAIGGRQKLDAIKSIYMQGHSEIMGNNAAIKIIKENGNLSRTTIETGNTKSFNLITKNTAWNYFSATMYDAEKVDNSFLPTLQTELDIAGPLVNYVEKEHKAELLGKENIDDTTCYKLRLTTKYGNSIIYWIDTNEYMLVKSTSTYWAVPGNNNEKNLTAAVQSPDKKTIFYKNYKAIDGILFAHAVQTITEAGEGRREEVTIFDKIEINITVDEKLYKPEYLS